MTPAIIFLETHNIQFSVHEYEHDPDSRSFGLEAAEKLGLDPKRVFKTLVVSDDRAKLSVGMVAVNEQLNLKRMASTLKMKKVQMADKRLVERTSGYVVGGVSPLGQKKRLRTILDRSATNYPSIFVSGGRRGLDIELKVQDLISLLDATLAHIC